MQTIFHAEYNTSHFDFTAIGKTEKAAVDTLLRALRAHGKQYDLPAGWYRDGQTADEFRMEVTVRQMHFGLGLRDGSPILL